MVNTLLNGPEGQETSPQVDPNEGKTPQWGYRRSDGEGQIFWLDPGQALPDGYEDTPAKCGPNAVEPLKPKAAEAPPAKPTLKLRKET